MRVRPRRLALFLAAILIAAFTFDIMRPPARQRSARAAVAAVRVYQRVAAPTVHRAGGRCRFEPSCSRYAEAAFMRYGFVRGGWRTVRRIARCGPWTPMGTVDQP